jgi:SAM-dependent methyltransferase
MDKNLEEYFEGKKLYGDDFTLTQIEHWFEEEKEGYAELGAKDKFNYTYPYRAQNELLGFDFLKSNQKFDVLSIGGAYGYELLPITSRAKTLTILEPSEQLRQERLEGLALQYLSPQVDGKIPLPDQSIDLITCFGVLHHIPNVSSVLAEAFRVLRPNGYFLVREPIVSMGDWTQKRANLTKNERGIPLRIFRQIVADKGFTIQKESLCACKPFDAIFQKLTKKPAYNSRFYVHIDKILSQALRFNYRYHAHSNWQKIRPSSVFYVLKK